MRAMMRAQALAHVGHFEELPAQHQPDWPDTQVLRAVCDRLALAVEPVDLWSCRMLHEELACAARGEGFVVIGGECAERFEETTPAHLIQKAEHLHRVGDIIQAGAGVPVTRIGRFGGQFAKPRSKRYEELSDGRVVPCYRGDAVNGLGVDERAHDPARLLTAHHHSQCAVRALGAWDRDRRLAAGAEAGSAPRTYVGHEALLLEYEQALLRYGRRHASSGHFLWIGDRTRDPDHAHIAFASTIKNPVGVKLGPSTEPAQVRRLIERLDPAHAPRPGRLSLILRMGAAASPILLPGVIKTLGDRAKDVLWIIDPMHANQCTNAHGQKTRILTDLQDEIQVVFQILAQHHLSPAGIHLEMTPDDVGECIEDKRDLSQRLLRYRSPCDPRLNPDQSIQIANLTTQLLASR
jgi:3-deoxy-7-phosphoheptulonate synthase